MKVMLDECITRKCALAVIEYLKVFRPAVKGHFLIDFMGMQGSKDIDWTSLLNPVEDWIVITADSGSSGPRIHAKGPPLHLILPRRKITGFFLSGKALTQGTGAERTVHLISKMPDILNKSARGRGGDRYKITMTGKGVVIKPWPLEKA